MKPITAIMYSIITLGLNTSPALADDSAQQKPKYAILLIDAEYPSEERPNLVNIDEELGNMSVVLTTANTQGIPVFEINFEDCEPFGEEYCSHNETAPELAKYRASNWIALRKKSASAFYETSLQTELSSRGITDLVLMGYNQNACMLETTDSALSLKYIVHTSFGVMQGYRDPSHCELIIDGKSIGEDYPCSDISPELVVKPLEYGLKRTIQYYKKNTHLVDDYRKLPVFEQ